MIRDLPSGCSDGGADGEPRRSGRRGPAIPVYATENPIGTQGGGQIDAAFLHALDRDNVYDHLSAGHTILQLAAADGVFYQRCYRHRA